MKNFEISTVLDSFATGIELLTILTASLAVASGGLTNNFPLIPSWRNFRRITCGSAQT